MVDEDGNMVRVEGTGPIKPNVKKDPKQRKMRTLQDAGEHDAPQLDDDSDSDSEEDDPSNLPQFDFTLS